MIDNILKNQMDCTCRDFLADVFGKRTKPFREAVATTFESIVHGKSTLVKDMSDVLRTGSSPAETKRVQEKMSGWLEHFDFSAALNPYLMKKALPHVGERTTFALDFSDISKEFGGKGMEGMAPGYDGSRHVTALGHDFVAVSIVGAEHREARPVYVKLGKGRKSKKELQSAAIDAVMTATGNRGWMLVDRGMDSAEFIYEQKKAAHIVVIRICDMKRDVFGDGRPIDEGLAAVAFAKTTLHTHKGDIKAEVRYRIGCVQYCNDPKRRISCCKTASTVAPKPVARWKAIENTASGKSLMPI